MDKLIKEALRKHKESILNRANVCGVGVGEKMVRADADAGKKGAQSIVVLVKKKLPENELRIHDVVPKDLDGVPTDVIEVGEIKLLDSRTEKYKKAKPGVSIGHYKITAGTLGAIVKDKATGAPMILSNNHVLANGTDGRDGKARKGDMILQPGPHDGGTDKDVIGRLDRFVPIYRSTIKPTCAKAVAAELWANLFVKMLAPKYQVKFTRQTQQENIVDAALAKPVDPETLDPEILEIGKINGISEAQTGMRVLKSGRTTGLTEGEVKAVSVSIQVDMGDGSEAIFSDQILASAMSQGGDSGSLVLDENKNAVGLLFAGSDKVTIINKIQNVMDKLSITL